MLRLQTQKYAPAWQEIALLFVLSRLGMVLVSLIAIALYSQSLSFPWQLAGEKLMPLVRNGILASVKRRALPLSCLAVSINKLFNSSVSSLLCL